MANVQKPAAASTYSLPGLDAVMSAESGSANEDELIRKFLQEPVAETPPAAAPVVKAAPEVTTIKPIKGEDITVFSERAGYENLEEFMQNPANKENIRTTDSGIPYVLEGVNYQVKPSELLVEGGATDISAPTTEGIKIGDETITMAEGGTTEEGVLGPPPVLAPGDEGVSVTKTEPAMVADLEVEPVVEEPKLDGPPVEEEIAEVIEEEPGDVTNLGITELTEASAKQTAQIVGTTLPDDSKQVYDDVLTKIEGLGFEVPKEDFYEKIAADINDRIEDYNINIATVASEKQKPTFEGWNKVLAVLGAAMGAYGSSMTGTPNFALKIIDGAIDRDTQAFLKSKETRMKSLENQRMDLIMRRGELLQFAQNRVSQLMQSETFKLATLEKKATIQSIWDGLEQRKSEAKQNMQLVLAGHIVKLITSEQTLAASLNKEEKARLVSHISFKDGKGNDFLAPAYVAPTVDEAKEARKKQNATKNILLIADQLEPLYDEASRFAPGAWSQVRIDINALNKKLESAVKIALGMGAHYTPYEVTIVAAQIPSATDWTEMVGTAKKKINALRDSMVIDMKSERQGVSTNFSTMPQKREIPGLEKGLIKTSK